MEPPPEHQIAITGDLASISPEVEARLRAVLASTLLAEGVPIGSLNLAITDDQEISDLNHRFRGISLPTDVLTFIDGSHGHLADIAISFPMALRQAESRGVPVADELAMLAIHGALHVAGFDDETDADRQQMVRRMNQRAAEVGIASDSEWWSHHYNWEVAACA